MINIKACPLCGGPARVYKETPSNDIPPWDHVVCINCGCGVNSVAQWNHRMSDPIEPPPKEYKYMTCNNIGPKVINEHGLHGWELYECILNSLNGEYTYQFRKEIKKEPIEYISRG